MWDNTSIYNNNQNIEKVFICIALIFGLLYTFIIPPFQMPDEDSHFKKSYLISQLRFLPDNNKDGEVGSFIPKAIVDFENKNRYMISDINAKYNYTKMYHDFALPVDYNDEVFVQYSTSKSNPLLFLPQSIAMLVTKLVTKVVSFGGGADLLTPATYMNVGRIGNLLFFILCAYLSIKIIPFYKNLLFILCLMPMTITLASSLSYDSMVLGIIFLFISIILNYAFCDNVKSLNKKHIIILCLLSVILIELKQVYFPIIFLFFLIPKRKFSSNKQSYISFLAMFLSGIIGHLVWLLILQIKTVGAVSDTESQFFNEQVMYIISHPIDYLLVIIRTLNESKFFYLNSLIGNLGWLDTNFPYVFILFFLVLIITLSFFDTNNKVNISFKVKIFSILIFLSVVVLIETSLYVVWTSIPENGGVGSPLINGVQGRYFIPAILTLLIIFYSNNTEKQTLITCRNYIINSVPIFSIFSCLLTLIILILRFWVPSL